MDTTKTPPVAKVIGKCVCNPGFGDKSALTPPDFTCGSCGENVESCTFDAKGLATVVCKATFEKAGVICAAKTASAAPSGFFFDATTSTFKGCVGNCLTCSGATASTCLTCKDKDSATYTEPTSEAATYATSFAGLTRVQINGTCLDACPTGFIANSARNSCVAGSASGSATGVFAVFALIASLFLIF
jgi:hypothetical protein